MQKIKKRQTVLTIRIIIYIPADKTNDYGHSTFSLKYKPRIFKHGVAITSDQAEIFHSNLPTPRCTSPGWIINGQFAASAADCIVSLSLPPCLSTLSFQSLYKELFVSITIAFFFTVSRPGGNLVFKVILKIQ